MGNLRGRHCRDDLLRCELESDLIKAFQINSFFKSKILCDEKVHI